jgi:acyl carrier protein phosphodiesterase
MCQPCLCEQRKFFAVMVRRMRGVHLDLLDGLHIVQRADDRARLEPVGDFIAPAVLARRFVNAS